MAERLQFFIFFYENANTDPATSDKAFPKQLFGENFQVPLQRLIETLYSIFMTFDFENLSIRPHALGLSGFQNTMYR